MIGTKEAFRHHGINIGNSKHDQIQAQSQTPHIKTASPATQRKNPKKTDE